MLYLSVLFLIIKITHLKQKIITVLFYEYLKGFGIVVNQEKEYIEAMLPNREVQEALAIDKQEPILKRVRMTKQKESDFREYSECFYIGKHYRYYIDFE